MHSSAPPRRFARCESTNKSLKAWGRVLHDDDLAQAIIDRVLERDRLLRLYGPSVRTLHINFDDAMNEDSNQPAHMVRIPEKPVRIAGTPLVPRIREGLSKSRPTTPRPPSLRLPVARNGGKSTATFNSQPRSNAACRR
jgi:hypothetical protein